MTAETAIAKFWRIKSNALRSRGTRNTADDIEQAADMLNTAADLVDILTFNTPAPNATVRTHRIGDSGVINGVAYHVPARPWFSDKTTVDRDRGWQDFFMSYTSPGEINAEYIAGQNAAAACANSHDR